MNRTFTTIWQPFRFACENVNNAIKDLHASDLCWRLRNGEDTFVKSVSPSKDRVVFIDEAYVRQEIESGHRKIEAVRALIRIAEAEYRP